jgi:hypothetical protein
MVTNSPNHYYSYRQSGSKVKSRAGKCVFSTANRVCKTIGHLVFGNYPRGGPSIGTRLALRNTLVARPSPQGARGALRLRLRRLPPRFTSPELPPCSSLIAVSTIDLRTPQMLYYLPPSFNTSIAARKCPPRRQYQPTTIPGRLRLACCLPLCPDMWYHGGVEMSSMFAESRIWVIGERGKWIVQTAANKTLTMPHCVLHAAGCCIGRLPSEMT